MTVWKEQFQTCFQNAVKTFSMEKNTGYPFAKLR